MTSDALPYIGTTIPARRDREWLTSAELINEAGISYRQLDYWCRTGLLTALPGKRAQGGYSDRPITAEMPGSGYQRHFDNDQAARARLIRLLLEAGISLQIIRAHIDEITATGRLVIGDITITIRDPRGDAA